jgi:DNA-binding response OmpR family regulator
LKEIRSVDRQTPVFLLTARSLKEDVLQGFRIGADDYLIKPFDTEVLLLKIEAILKRSFGEVRQQDQQIFGIGKFTFDYKHRSLVADGQTQSLTPKEAELLRLLCLHRNDLLPRTKALKLIWGDDNYFNGRSMDVFVTRLRKYLKNDPSVEITSLHGKGMQLTTAS